MNVLRLSLKPIKSIRRHGLGLLPMQMAMQIKQKPATSRAASKN